MMCPLGISHMCTPHFKLEVNRLAPRNMVGQLYEMGSKQKIARTTAFKNLYRLMTQEIAKHTTSGSGNGQRYLAGNIYPESSEYFTIESVCI
ncbi:hypothetical protein DPMN_186417 [Dreissena polymorpha]|uniref:Uncharacterized protein n=1 Tax=Dreissena polymorpha TaxID=45954 RepID=A0A9D4I6I1_DREPO|nr:hypothetical protein DPMN_186417 [Dreissena polymorpha]